MMVAKKYWRALCVWGSTPRRLTVKTDNLRAIYDLRWS